MAKIPIGISTGNPLQGISDYRDYIGIHIGIPFGDVISRKNSYMHESILIGTKIPKGIQTFLWELI